MTSRATLPFLALIALLGCKTDPKTGASGGTPQIETESPNRDAANAGEATGAVNYCFVSRTPTPEEFGDTYNYHFIRLQMDPDGNVKGTAINAPYGTDGSRGSISGTYREGEKRVRSTTSYLAEGDLYEEQRDYTIGAGGLTLLDAGGEAVFTVPAVPCEQYDALMKEYQQGILRIRVNTTDRSRIEKMEDLAALGFSAEQVGTLRFMETWVDLDNRVETEEYLVYLMDPTVCGTGGCNLYIINGNGETLSSTSVVKLPIYMPVPMMADMKAQGDWKPLFVWSRGYRKLETKDGRYPANASLEPEVSEESLKNHPERYRLVLDYLE